MANNTKRRIIKRKVPTPTHINVKIPYNLYQRVYVVARQEKKNTKDMIFEILNIYIELRKELGPLSVYIEDANRNFNGTMKGQPYYE